MNAPVRTLNFHGIGTPGPGIDASEVPYWIDIAFFDALVDELARPEFGRTWITFDDGNLSDLSIAAPRLAARGLAARVFVLTGRIGTPGYLDEPDIRELVRMGFVIGSHGQDHLNWASLAGDPLRRETADSRAQLEALLGKPVTEAAIPFGSYNRAVLSALRSAGYTVAWTSDGGDMNPSAFLRPRLSVRSGMTVDSVRHALLGPISPARRLRRALAMARKRFL